MTPEWVVENYLPDYEEKFTAYCESHKENGEYGTPLFSKELREVFAYWHFPEALEHLLKAQRESCNEEYQNLSVEIDNGYSKMISVAILSAPIPEPRGHQTENHS